jgi:DNA-binding Xre family transcriptional regulator
MEVNDVALRIDEQKVREKMVARKMYTILDLVDAAGVTDRTIRKLFAGSVFQSDTLERIATALQCRPEDLYVYEPDRAVLPHTEAPAFAEAACS